MRFLAVVFAFFMSLLGFAPAQAAVDVKVDLAAQTMQVTSSSGETHVWKISSGRKGFSTPRGSYRPTRLVRMHYSRKYDNAPMPHSIFFRGGYAIHATSEVGRLGRTASHGCIRLAPGNAAQLYAMVQREGARISISGQASHETMTAGKSERKRFAKAKSKRTQLAKASGAPQRAAAGLRGSYAEPALGYAGQRRAPSLFEWLRAPSR